MASQTRIVFGPPPYAQSKGRNGYFNAYGATIWIIYDDPDPYADIAIEGKRSYTSGYAAPILIRLTLPDARRLAQIILDMLPKEGDSRYALCPHPI